MRVIETPPASVQKQSGTIYNRIFWMAYVANVSLVTANALSFRFAELVAFLGGTDQMAGSLVSTGVIGAFTARLLLGQFIDRYGTRRLWIAASGLFICGCGMFLAVRDLSWSIYVARMAFAVGLAGMFTCSMVHIQNQVPTHRRTEIIGSLGSSGFIGIILGTQLGDWIFRVFAYGQPQFLVLFGTAAALGLIYVVIVGILTHREVHRRPHATPAVHRLIVRYWPGNVVCVAVMTGVVFTVTTVFLTRFATHRGLDGIGTFFTVFAVSAFWFRVYGRRWSRAVGRHRLILIGMAGQCVGLCALPLVTSQWHFVFPAAASGFGHALLFPSIVSMGAGAFPQQYRGTGTTVFLGFTEVGSIVSAPLLGGVIDRLGFSRMFLISAAAVFLVGVIYAISESQKHDDDIKLNDGRRAQRSTPDRQSV